MWHRISNKWIQPGFFLHSQLAHMMPIIDLEKTNKQNSKTSENNKTCFEFDCIDGCWLINKNFMKLFGWNNQFYWNFRIAIERERKIDQHEILSWKCFMHAWSLKKLSLLKFIWFEATRQPNFISFVPVLIIQ